MTYKKAWSVEMGNGKVQIKIEVSTAEGKELSHKDMWLELVEYVVGQADIHGWEKNEPGYSGNEFYAKVLNELFVSSVSEYATVDHYAATDDVSAYDWLKVLLQICQDEKRLLEKRPKYDDDDEN